MRPRRISDPRAELAALHDIGEALSGASDLNNTLRKITETTANVMRMDSCSIFLVDKAGRALTLKASTGLSPEAINIGSDEETTIRGLAEAVVRLSGRNTEIVFDASKPSGQPRRSCDTRLAKRLLDFRADVPLHEGLKRTIEWYRCNPKG